MFVHILIGIAVLVGLFVFGCINYKQSVRRAEEWSAVIKKSKSDEEI